MARYQGVETDLNGAIVPGAKIYVYQFDGKTLAALKDDFGSNLPNPVISDNLGSYSFNVASQGLYYLKHNVSGRYELFEITAVGELIAAVLPSLANAGKFIALDAGGAPAYSSGTGSDAALRTDLANATVGAALAAFSRATPASPGTVAARLAGDTYLTDAPYSVPIDNTAANGPLNTLFAAIDTSGGAGDLAKMPKGRLRLTGATIVMRDRVVLAGKTIRSAIVSIGAGSGFVFDGIEHSGLRQMRIGLDANSSLTAVSVKTTSASAVGTGFSNLEIVGASIAGQVGMRFAATGGQIITEGITSSVKIEGMDKPVIDFDSEGNFRFGLIIDGFAYGAAQIGMDLRTNANVDICRIARATTNGSTAYKQQGNRNIAVLVTDLGPATGPNCDALNVTGTDNFIILQRPEGSTRLGSFAVGNAVMDGANLYCRRVTSRGVTPTSANFTLGSGFGSTATVTAITGDDQMVRFTINCSGSGIAANPNVTYNNVDGAWPNGSACIQPTRDGGNQKTVGFTGSQALSTGWSTNFDGTPVSGEMYVMIVRRG